MNKKLLLIFLSLLLFIYVPASAATWYGMEFITANKWSMLPNSTDIVPSKFQLPPSTNGHTSVVINNKMYTFGGQKNSDSSYTNTLYELEPVKGEWIDLSFSGLPSARTGVKGVALNDKIYVYGGSNNTTKFNEYWVIDPINKTSQQLNPTGVASVPWRSDFSMMEYGGKIYFFGGKDASSTLVSTMYAWDPVANTISQLSPTGTMPTARSNHMTWVMDGKMYIYAGNAASCDSAYVYIYDFATDNWTRASSTGITSCGYLASTAPVVLNGKAYNFAFNTTYRYASDTKCILEFDPSTNAWTARIAYDSAIPAYRTAISLVAINGVIYGYGGMGTNNAYADFILATSNPYRAYLLSLFNYKPSVGENGAKEVFGFPTMPLTSAVPPVNGSSGAVIGEYLYANVTNYGLYKYSFVNQKWSYIPWTVFGNSDSYKMSLRYYQDGWAEAVRNKLYIGGGVCISSTAGCNSTTQQNYLNSIFMLDPASNSWQADTGPSGVGIASAVLNDQIFLYGGEYWQTNVGYVTSSGLYKVYGSDANEIVNAMISTTGASPGVSKFGAAAVVDGKFYFHGGAHKVSGINYYHDGLYQYNPDVNNWTQIATTGDVPGFLDSHNAEAAGSKMVIYAGMSSGDSNGASRSVTNNLYELDTTTNTWTKINISNPAQRYGAISAMYQGNMVIFGGYSNLNDLWQLEIVKDDTKSPNVSVAQINGGASSTTNSQVNLSITADGMGNPVKYIVVSNDAFQSYEIYSVSSDANGMATLTTTWNVPPGPGTKTVYVKAFNAYGAESPPKSAAIYLDDGSGPAGDTTPPVITEWQIDDNSGQTSASTVTAYIKGVSDNVTLPDSLVYRLSTDGGSTFNSYNGTGWVTGWSTDFRYTLPNIPVAVGQNVMILQVKDQAGNVGSSILNLTRTDPTTAPATDSTVTSPTPTATIGENLNGQIINIDGYNAQVSQKVASDLVFTNLQNAAKIYYSLDGINFSQPFSIPSGNTSYTLTVPFSSEGLKPVYFQLESTQGAKSSLMKRMFLVDDQAPTAELTIENFANASTSLNVVASVKDNVSTNFSYRYNTGSGWSAWTALPSTSDFSIPISTSTGAIKVQFADKAGNTIIKSLTKSTFVDSTAPVISEVSTVNKATLTYSTNLSLIVVARDDVSTSLQYRYDATGSGSSYSGWAALSADGVIPVAVSSAAGYKPILINVKDQAGNITSKLFGIWKQ